MTDVHSQGDLRLSLHLAEKERETDNLRGAFDSELWRFQYDYYLLLLLVTHNCITLNPKLNNTIYKFNLKMYDFDQKSGREKNAR